MFHVRLTRFPLLNKDVTNVDGAVLLEVFVNPWLAGDPIIWDGRRYEAAKTKLTIYEGPALTTFQNGWRAWLKVVELCENVTEAMLTERGSGIARSVADAVGSSGPPIPGPADSSTASRRPLTGLNRSGREVMLQRLAEAGAEPAVVLAGFLRHSAISGLPDYLDAVAQVWGLDGAAEVKAAVDTHVSARIDENRLDWQNAEPDAWQTHAPMGLLLAMPEPDFLTAIEQAVRLVPDPYQRAGVLAAQLNQVCERRGVHFRLTGMPSAFTWTSDPTTLRDVIAPALDALGDNRLAAGPGVEYASARAELRVGTPAARKQAVAEACNAVESTMQVLAEEHELMLTGKSGAQNQFTLLCNNNVVHEATETLVLAPSRFGNKRGRHGAGASAHDVTADEAEAVVRAAGVAISFLAQHLPPAR